MKNIRVFYLNIFQFLEVKFSIYLNRRVFVMIDKRLQIFYSNLSLLSWEVDMRVIPASEFEGYSL